MRPSFLARDRGLATPGDRSTGHRVPCQDSCKTAIVRAPDPSFWMLVKSRVLAGAVALALAGVVVLGCGGQRSTDDPRDPNSGLPSAASTTSSSQPLEQPSSAPSTQDVPGPTVPCSTHPNQAAAQRAADTRDPDRDGVYCESLSCPCAGSTSGVTSVPDPASQRRSCARPRRVQPVGFSATRYPRIRAHALSAIRRGWPSILVLNRAGADARRDQLLENVPTRFGHDRDEYPPAIGRGRGAGLMRGVGPRGWKGDVAYVPSGENRSHGSVLGIKLRRFCDGTRFRYVFY